MRDTTKASLDDILKRNAQLVDAREQAKAVAEDESVKGLADFKRLCEVVIQPVFEDFSARLKEAGHGTQISVTTEERDRNGARTRSDAIALNLYPKGIPMAEFYRSHGSTPHITFLYDRTSRKVTIRTSNMTPRSGGSEGSKATLALSSIDGPLVERETLTAIQEVLLK